MLISTSFFHAQPRNLDHLLDKKVWQENVKIFEPSLIAYLFRGISIMQPWFKKKSSPIVISSVRFITRADEQNSEPPIPKEPKPQSIIAQIDSILRTHCNCPANPFHSGHSRTCVAVSCIYFGFQSTFFSEWQRHGCKCAACNERLSGILNLPRFSYPRSTIAKWDVDTISLIFSLPMRIFKRKRGIISLTNPYQ